MAPVNAPLFVAEELALDQAGGQGGTVDLDQRLVFASARGMNGPGDELLAGARFAGHEHGRIGWSDRANVIEHGGQGRAAADDLVEIERGLDFFLQVGVLLLQLFALALGHHEVGDVDDHGPRVLAVRLGAGPELHPDRLAIVFAAELELEQAALLPLADVGEHCVESFSVFGRRGHERHADGLGHLRRRNSEQLLGRAIRAHEVRVGRLVDVGDGGFVE
jgi:hypothetical protein